MRFSAITILAAALAGCAHTTAGFRQQAPKLEMISDKKPEAISGCVTEAWAKTRLPTSYTPLPRGGSVSLDVPTLLISTGNKFGVVDAESVDGRTRVRIYGINMVGAKQNRVAFEAAKACL